MSHLWHHQPRHSVTPCSEEQAKPGQMRISRSKMDATALAVGPPHPVLGSPIPKAEERIKTDCNKLRVLDGSRVRAASVNCTKRCPGDMVLVLLFNASMSRVNNLSTHWVLKQRFCQPAHMKFHASQNTDDATPAQSVFMMALVFISRVTGHVLADCRTSVNKFIASSVYAANSWSLAMCKWLATICHV